MKRWIALAFFAALLIRLGFLWEASQAPFFRHLVADSLYYHTWAERIAGNDWVGDSAFWVDPLYAYLLTIIRLITGPCFWAPLLLQTLFGGLTCVLVYLIGIRLFTQKTAVIAAWICALCQTMVFYDGVLLKTSFTTFSGCLFLYLLLRAKDSQGFCPWILSGLCLGLCCLFRSSSLLLIPCVLVWSVFIERKTQNSLLLKLALFLGAAFLLILPVTIRNYALTKDTILLTANFGQNLFLGNNPFNTTGTYTAPPFFREESEREQKEWTKYAKKRLKKKKLKPSEVSSYWTGETIKWAKNNPDHFFTLLLKKLRLTWNWFEVPDNYDIYFYKSQYSTLLNFLLPFRIIGPLAICGLLLALGGLRKRLLLYLFVICFSLLPVIFFVFARFRLPYTPFLCLFAAFAVTTIIAQLREKRYFAASVPLMILAGAAILVNAPIENMHPSKSVKPYYNLGSFHFENKEYESAIGWYKKAIEINPNVSEFYTNMGCAHFELNQLDEAEKAFLTALDKDPKNRYSHKNLGILYWSKNKKLKALHHFEEDAGLFPARRPVFLTHQASYRILVKDWQGAKTTLEELNRLQPKNIQTKVLQARVALELEEFDQAKAKLTKILTSRPNHGEARFYLFLTLWKQDPQSKAEAMDHLIKAKESGYPIPEEYLKLISDK